MDFPEIYLVLTSNLIHGDPRTYFVEIYLFLMYWDLFYGLEYSLFW